MSRQVGLFLAVAIITGLLAAGHEGDAVFSYNPDNLVRLHVLAHSDGERDQVLKMEVKDAVIAESRFILAKALTREDALRALTLGRARLEEAARRRLEESGSDCPVQVAIERKPFPPRDYGGMEAPAGMYDAVTVTIGDGGGSNWWCVVFPPLCLVDTAVEPQVKVNLDLELFRRHEFRPRFVTWEWLRKVLPGWDFAAEWTSGPQD
ncbi:MAG: stage II sporulation protein R [Bacillota bacterium]